MKTLILSISAFALLGGSGLDAQTRATAKIPFAFTAQETALPAGDYIMSKLTTSRNTMLLRNDETGQAILVFAPDNLCEYKGGPDKNVVLFHRIGDRYFLAEVNTAGLKGHVPASKLEREVQSEGSGQSLAVIVPALSAH